MLAQVFRNCCLKTSEEKNEFILNRYSFVFNENKE